MQFFVTGGSGFLGQHLLRALAGAGHSTRALARSTAAEDTVRAAGAEPVRGELGDVDTLRRAMANCDVVVHAAAMTEAWAPAEKFHRVNVAGTETVLLAARAAGVPRLVHVSTEAVLADGKPLVRVDETRPRAAHPLGLYPKTKALAEELVEAANSPELSTVAVRPRFVWGPDDTSILPEIARVARSGRFAWIDGGRYATSTCHVANACEGILLAAESRADGAFFLTDGEPVEFRAFMTALAGTRGIELPDRSMPHWVAVAGAAVAETAWTLLPLAGAPPLTRTFVAVSAQEMTVDDGRARRELGYVGKTSREDGLAQLAA